MVSMLKSIGKDVSNVDGMTEKDRDRILAESRETAIKARDDELQRTQDQAKRIDYITRALRDEEMPLIKKQYEEHKVGRLAWLAAAARLLAGWLRSVHPDSHTPVSTPMCTCPPTYILPANRTDGRP